MILFFLLNYIRKYSYDIIMFPRIDKIMYTIKQGNKTFGLMHGEQFYIIGFSNNNMTRKVQYGLHPTPYINLKKNKQIELDIMKKKIIIAPNSELSIQKYTGEQNQMNDGNYHLSIHYDSEFLIYPYKNMIGIIIPHSLEEETETEFHFTSTVIDPFFDPDLYKMSIDNKI